MSEIALYNILRKMPNVSDAEAKEAVADIANARDVATKADIAEVKTEIAELRAQTKADIAEIKAGFKYMQWAFGLLFIMNAAILLKLFF